MFTSRAAICILSFAASSASFAVYGVTSFGYGIVYQLIYQVLSLFSLTSGDVSDALQEIYVCALPVCSLQAFLLRRHLDPRFAIASVVLLLTAQPFGLGLLLFLEGTAALLVKRLLGCLFLVIATMQCVMEIRPKQQVTTQLFRTLPSTALVALVSALFAEGFLGGLFGTGGPATMIYLLFRPMDIQEWRANQALAFMFSSLEGYFLFSQQGDALALSWDQRVALASGALIGLIAGNALAPRISLAQFRRALLWMVFVGACTLLATGYPKLEMTVAALSTTSVIVANGVSLVWSRVEGSKQVQEALLLNEASCC